MNEHFELRVEDDDVVEAFFSQPPPAVEAVVEPWEPRPMTAGERKAMRATVAMLGFFAVGSVCLAAYAELAMVKPAPLAAAGLPPRSASASTEAESTSAAPPAEEAPRVASAPQAAQPRAKVQDPTAQRTAEPLPSAKRPHPRELAGTQATFRDCAQRAQDRLVSACKTLAR